MVVFDKGVKMPAQKLVLQDKLRRTKLDCPPSRLGRPSGFHREFAHRTGTVDAAKTAWHLYSVLNQG